ncbi:uncharacterized protein LOC114544599 [Dendronephthya gigantea]|uniref:uncharacterized protein LOC114544067 n=1 Tax=Dendronephthya gigantea TaxID=151771 RepID=UPI00106968C8|nr:uncharacterized protein LOC114544067 [Dendronephthya gigantea]XP_028418653.1 uncharacterized protein LOC114544128 [Dendronephthya gigantea]XP_028418989.1 uncharacterized protein LOC114544599 [Dendronephthya gigantea]
MDDTSSLLLEKIDVQCLEELNLRQAKSRNDSGETGDSAEESPETENNEFDKEFFLEEVRTLSCLWNTSLSTYKDRTAKANAWKKLSEILNRDVDLFQRQLKNLKDNLKKCLDKRSKMTRSGATASCLPMCRYFEQMAFLYGCVGNRPTESNLNAILSPPADTITVEGSSSGCTPTKDVPTTSTRMQTTEAARAHKRPLSSELFSTNRSGNRMNRDVVELMLLKQLTDSDAMYKKMTEEDDDEDSLYCRSLVPIMKGLPDKKRRLAKIKISQLLFEVEFDDVA